MCRTERSRQVDADRLEEGVIDTRDETQKISHMGTNTRTTMRSRKQRWCLGKPQNCLVWLEAKPRGRAGDRHCRGWQQLDH